MVEEALKAGDYKVAKPKQPVGTKPSGGKYRVDRIVERPDGSLFLLSLKWQQVGGTTEEKIPYEVITLAHVLEEQGRFSAAYLVLGGHGWTLREFYAHGGLDPYLRKAEHVRILDLEDFVAKANRGQL